MKLVQMPVDLLHVQRERLPELGVDPRLLAGFEAYLARTPEGSESLVILGPPQAGTRVVLMVLARQVGAALRDENIRLRDSGGDLNSGRKKLCYLPGVAARQALRDVTAWRSLECEAACFLQDADAAVQGVDDAAALLDLIDARLATGLPTFLSADPAAVPPELVRGLRARLAVIEAGT